MSDLPTSVEIKDDTMREGLQIESPDIPVSEKLRLLDAISETGAKVINIGSFVSPKWVPQMAFIDEIAERFVPKPGVRYTATALNARGHERAAKYYPKIELPFTIYQTGLTLSNTFVLRNTNKTQAQEIASWQGIIDQARKAGVGFGNIRISTPWGCNFEGDFTFEQRMSALQAQIDLWHDNGFVVKKCLFSDATGWNMPDQVKETIYAFRQKWPEITDVRCHFHNTRGVAIVSYYEALKLGVRYFDTCLGGLGGCPYCGNGIAAGQVPTEDFVYMCEEMGIRTGYDLDKTVEAAVIAEEVIGHPLWGHVSKAGPRPRGTRLYPKDLPFIQTLEEASHFRKGPSVYAHQFYPVHRSG
ncbi:MAG: citramalate synthase [Chloroflexi bacterium]|nr:citramalate synthase [Chloroflexota bacterium]